MKEAKKKSRVNFLKTINMLYYTPDLLAIPNKSMNKEMKYEEHK